MNRDQALAVAIDVVGWVGVVVLLVAYWLVSTRRMQGTDVSFQVMNIAGAVALIVNSSFYGALPSVGVNVAWIGIGGYALVRSLRSPRERSFPGPTEEPRL